MCGIAGFVTRSGASRPDLDAALGRLQHRGPDGVGRWFATLTDSTVGFGHTRLAILDLSAAGAQPMTSADGRWVLVFNGEIYNHALIRTRLAPRTYRGHSDTETLVEAIAEWGVSRTLSELDGMFAFAAFDCAGERLYLARDPFGVKPVYYSSKPSALAFASEIEALVSLQCEQPRGLDPAGLAAFLALRYVPSPRTLLRGIERLPPGHVLEYDCRTTAIDVRPYVLRSDACAPEPSGDLLERYDALLTEAVGAQMLSDVPIGLLLSGGIDSALIAAVSRKLGYRLQTFSVGFDDGSVECELTDAAKTAAVLGLPNAGILADPTTLWAALEEIFRSVEEPLGTTSVLPMWFLAKRARQDVKVVLTGQGSDEPWGGYRRYQLELLRERHPTLARLPHRIGLALAMLPRLPDHMARGARSIGISDDVRRLLEAERLFDANDQLALSGDTSDAFVVDRIAYWKQLTGGHLPAAESMMAVDARMNLSDDLLLYGDKITMAHSLEARVPMLHLPLMRFVESLPIKYRVTTKETKILHRALAKKYLPDAIIARPKRGFEMPFGKWSRTIWRARIEEVLLDGSAAHTSFLDQSTVRRLWGDHVSGRRDRSRQMFALLSLAIWARQLGQTPSAAVA